MLQVLEGRNQGQNSDMGEGGIINGQNNSDVFYRRPQITFPELQESAPYLSPIGLCWMWGLLNMNNKRKAKFEESLEKDSVEYRGANFYELDESTQFL